MDYFRFNPICVLVNRITAFKRTQSSIKELFSGVCEWNKVQCLSRRRQKSSDIRISPKKAVLFTTVFLNGKQIY